MEKQWNARLFLLNFFANNEQITNKFFRKVQFFKSSTRTLGLSSAEGNCPGPLPSPVSLPLLPHVPEDHILMARMLWRNPQGDLVIT